MPRKPISQTSPDDIKTRGHCAGAAAAAASPAATDFALLPYKTGPPISVERLEGLGPLAVISRQTAATLLNISIDTLRRMERAGTAPKRVQLSPRRIGFRVCDLRAYIEALPAI
jgi:hypothetical protein